ncbi:serine/threonine receptor-like kinase NFP [Canna indica]|uniref:Serine/threonine receptor-like kinase NFP n=1 Tax=Canna indica TaxID=4628 RepID=A0AAQ3KWA0_9LILI|nr:serine/threonine receptor-like kinase NFP [Canna indica]
MPCLSANPARVPLSKDFASVDDLFGVSRAMIARSSNLTVIESSCPLRQIELLLIPITCGYARNRSYTPTAYQIIADDTFYLVSTVTYGNLTAYSAVDNKSILGLVTYVLQPADTYTSLAASFGTDVTTLIAINGSENIMFFVGGSDVTNVLLIWCSRRSSRKGKEVGKFGSSVSCIKGGGGSEFGRLPSAEDKLIGDISEWLDKYKVFSVEELWLAMAGFAKSHLIQGSVYKGTMEDEEVHARGEEDEVERLRLA